MSLPLPLLLGPLSWALQGCCCAASAAASLAPVCLLRLPSSSSLPAAAALLVLLLLLQCMNSSESLAAKDCDDASSGVCTSSSTAATSGAAGGAAGAAGAAAGDTGESGGRASGVSHVFASSFPLLRRPTSAVARTLTRFAPSHLTFLPSKRQLGHSRSSSRLKDDTDAAPLTHQQQQQQQQQQQRHRTLFRTGGEGRERQEGEGSNTPTRRSCSRGRDRAGDIYSSSSSSSGEGSSGDTASGQAKSAASLYAFVTQQLPRLARLKTGAEWGVSFSLLPPTPPRGPGCLSPSPSVDLNGAAQAAE